MTWECAECHAVEDRNTRVDAVCHHCGKALCRFDQRIFPDHAFAAGSGSIGAQAVHCRDCSREYHSVDAWLGAKAP
jgi:hypothetical protein